ncbi:MAG: MFS transporter [Cyanobacteria bacterium P01_C01_bin.89]
MTDLPSQHPEQAPEPAVSLWQPFLTNRNFRLLAIGETVSNFGDQFYFVALPWLTLQLTGSPLDLGAVLMTVAIPRAILMVLGGALSDRLSPRNVMLISNGLRVVLTAILAALVGFQATQLWHLYLLAFSFGVIEGFFSPAAEAIVPTLVSKDQLVASNVLGQSANQLILFIGPALAGAVIAAVGVGAAFTIDALSFLVSSTALLLIHPRRSPSLTSPTAHSCCASDSSAVDSSAANLSAVDSSAVDLSAVTNGAPKGLMLDISEGLQYSWQNRPLRTLLLSLTVYNFLFIGPLQVGIVALAQDRFAAAGALALGIAISAWGAGGLLGSLLPQWIPNLPPLGTLMLLLASIQGVGMVAMSFVPHWLLASLVSLVLGGCSSFFILIATTWIQRKTPPEILGRVMGVSLLASLGVTPFSYALAGILANVNLLTLFGGTGLAMIIFSALLTLSPTVRKIS